MDFNGRERYGIEDLLSIMELLRSPEGCPWDREQTHESIRRNFIEETYEVVEAIDNRDPGLLCEELGDVLLQVVFHARMEEEKGSFAFSDICDGVCKKLITRHPHIFSDVKADSSEQVLRNWDEIKKREKQQKTNTEVLRSVPKTLPALMRSEKVQSKASKYGFCYKTAFDALRDVKNELDELEREIDGSSREKISDELGDLLFATANLARHFKIDPEESLARSCDKFIERFDIVERLADEREIELQTAGQNAVNSLWQEAKHYNL